MNLIIRKWSSLTFLLMIFFNIFHPYRPYHTYKHCLLNNHFDLLQNFESSLVISTFNRLFTLYTLSHKVLKLWDFVLSWISPLFVSSWISPLFLLLFFMRFKLISILEYNSISKQAFKPGHENDLFKVKHLKLLFLTQSRYFP